MTRQEPFQEFDNFEEFRIAVCINKIRPHMPPEAPASLRQLIELCWDPSPQKRPSFTTITSALDVVLVDCAISVEWGRVVWKGNFLKKEVIPWNDFMFAFMQLLQKIGPPRVLKSDQPLPLKPSLWQLRHASEEQLREFANRSQENGYLASQEYSRRHRVGNDITMELEEDLFNWCDEDDENISFNFKCLKAVLAEKPKPSEGVVKQDAEEMVNLEKFGRILEWFGPIIDPLSREISFFDRITSLLQQKWFHGDLATSIAESRLSSESIGTYLLRFSSTNPGCYTISRKTTDGSITHQRIFHQAGHGFYINNQRYDSLEQLVELSKNPLNLAFPCPGSPFLQLFVEHRISGYEQTQAPGGYAQTF